MMGSDNIEELKTQLAVITSQLDGIKIDIQNGKMDMKEDIREIKNNVDDVYSKLNNLSQTAAKHGVIIGLVTAVVVGLLVASVTYYVGR